jgi:hypothetical protein
LGSYVGCSLDATRLIAGELDYQIGLEPQRELASRLPDPQLLVYEGAGHFMYVDQPERFARDVAAFFNADASAALTDRNIEEWRSGESHRPARSVVRRIGVESTEDLA